MTNRISPIIEAHGVEKELNSAFFSELLPVIFDDSGHVLDMTFIGRSKKHKSERVTLRDTYSIMLRTQNAAASHPTTPIRRYIRHKN